jgi:hypothetical protein
LEVRVEIRMAPMADEEDTVEERGALLVKVHHSSVAVEHTGGNLRRDGLIFVGEETWDAPTKTEASKLVVYIVEHFVKKGWAVLVEPPGKNALTVRTQPPKSA